MLLADLDSYFRALLRIDETAGIDSSLNGLQVDRRNGEIARVAFAVDACMETFHRAVEASADVLFVHHGLFWGESLAVRRSHGRRLRCLLENDLALYAVHLPLDLHPQVGNNAGMALRLGLKAVEPFGVYHGLAIGCRGTMPEPAGLDDVIDRLGFDKAVCTALLPFGPQLCSSVGIVSGGATREFDQAVDEGLDLYITGDASHTIYHTAVEERVNVLCAGHYQTETFGVKAVAERLSCDHGVETMFIDVPTGL